MLKIYVKRSLTFFMDTYKDNIIGVRSQESGVRSQESGVRSQESEKFCA